MTASLVALATLPAATAAADVPHPQPPVVVVDTGGLNASDLVDAAKKTACTPTGDASDFDSWAGALDARVNTDPLRPQIQFVWDTFDSSAGTTGASALAWVPDTGCAKDVKVTAQITDTSPAANCRPTVSGPVVTTYGHQHWTADDGTNLLVGVNPSAFQLPVTYYGDDGPDLGVTGNTTAAAPGEVSPYCVRSSSVVSVETNGYYENNLNKYVWFACEDDEYQITATPTGPQINYVDTVKCAPSAA
jgi:hypothetical protein